MANMSSHVSTHPIILRISWPLRSTNRRCESGWIDPLPSDSDSEQSTVSNEYPGSHVPVMSTRLSSRNLATQNVLLPSVDIAVFFRFRWKCADRLALAAQRSSRCFEIISQAGQPAVNVTLDHHHIALKFSRLLIAGQLPHASYLAV